MILLSCNKESEMNLVEIKHENDIVSAEFKYDSLAFIKRAYVPIYSHIYHGSKGGNILLTATLSIRNTSFTDTLYIRKIDYFDSHGELIKNYINELILLKPMHALEFIVEEKEDKGGTGANFIVDYGYNSKDIVPLIQAVMIGTSGQQGISFLTESIDIPY
jgi:hypothetical protein